MEKEEHKHHKTDHHKSEDHKSEDHKSEDHKSEHKHPPHKHPTHHTHKNVKKEKFKPSVGHVVLGVAALILIVILIIKFSPGEPAPIDPIDVLTGTPDVAAIVNGEEISVQEIEDQWEILPDEYKSQVSKNVILSQTIEKSLLLQDAASKGITVSTERATEFVENLLSESGFSQDYLEAQLSERGVTMDEITEMYREQLIVVDLVNQTIFPMIEVTDEEVEAFYEANKENLDGMEDSRDEVIMLLKMGKQTGAINDYVQGLKEDAEIEVIYDFESEGTTPDEGGDTPEGEITASSITTFDATGDERCEEDGKPVIYLFSTTWCSHCKWVGPTFDKVALEYVDKGLIKAYHWHIDNGDDTLTTAVETEVPAEHMAIYQKYNPRGSIPTFVMGCEYSRVGNGHEATDDVSLEEAEFRAVFDELVG